MLAVNILYKTKKIIQLRPYCSTNIKTKGAVLGVINDHKNGKNNFTFGKIGEKLTVEDSQILKLLNIGPPIKKNDTRLLWNLQGPYNAMCFVGLDGKNAEDRANDIELIDQNKEQIRVAAGLGSQLLATNGITEICLDDFDDVEAAVEGASLGTWLYQQYKSKSEQKPIPKLITENIPNKHFNSGLIKAEAQNFARYLMETPANLMTPQIFAKKVTEELKDLCTVTVRDKKWIEDQKMGSFLSVAKGSAEPPVFVEINYKGGNDKKTYVLVGKGITFDSGGISIKPSNKMELMRADMGGAACVAATIKAIAQLKLPINVTGLIPLCENMPSGTANKPGDVVIAKNGKSIGVYNTDAEGRLILADALCYSENFNPECVIDIATLTGAMSVALGDAAAGVFSNSNSFWDQLQEASYATGDRVWRMPLWKHYSTFVTKSPSFDLCNISIDAKGGGACTAAAFLREFIPKNTNWMHLDIAGVMDSGAARYVQSGMTGRPTRTLVKFFENLSTSKCKYTQ